MSTTPPRVNPPTENPGGVVRPRRVTTPRSPAVPRYRYKTPRCRYNLVAVPDAELESSSEEEEHQFINPSVKRRLVFD